MLTIIVEFEVDPANRDRLLDLLSENAGQSVAREPGCLQFDIATPLGSEGAATIVLYEIYADEAAFAAHLASAHYLAFARAADALVHAKQVRRLRLDWSNLHTSIDKVRKNVG